MSNLNKDILFLTFEKLQDDSNSLLSCSMVNKLWCITAIPILWRNPWRHYIDNKKNQLFDIIASYLPDDIKELLTNQKIKLTCKSPLFDYLSYCKSINVKIIDSVISIVSHLPDDQFLLLKREFYKLLINKFSGLQYLEMINIEHQIFYFSEAKPRLELLTELTCDTTVDSFHFCGLAKICKRIRKIKIINRCIKFNRGIVDLIEAQKNLRYFEWKDEFEDDEFEEDPYEKVFSALAKEENILDHLRVFFLYIYPYEYTPFKEVLHKFHNLRSLIIICDDFLITEEQSIKLIYHNLEILNIDYIKLNVASSIIENSGGNIKEILLNNNDFVDHEDNFSEDSLTFVRKIYKYCPLIRYLSLALSSSDEHFTEFEKLLKYCKNLQSLLIIFKLNTTDDDIIIGDKLLDILISSKTNLKEIRFFNNFRFSSKSLGSFFEKWKGRSALSLLTCDTTYQKKYYKTLIKKYKDEGVIKKFKIIFEDHLYIH
jgi:hypothetical protein